MTHEEKRRFPDISSRSWEHPADRAALTALRQLKGLDELVKAFVGLTSEKAFRLMFLSSAVRVNDRQFPRLSTLVDQACEILDVTERPEVFVTQNPVLNAFTLGIRKPLVVLNSSLIGALTDQELLGVIAHEVGHIASDHVQYKTLLWLLVQISTAAGAGLPLSFPVSQVVLLAIVTALREWDRKSELSADRAELLVLQDPAIAYSLLMKLSGGTHTDEMNIEEFFAQAEEYERGGDVLDNLYKTFQLVGQSHPFPVLRVGELKRWIDSGAYGKIMDGDYVGRKRGGATVQDDFKEAADEYRREWDKGAEVFRSAFDNLAKDAQKTGKDIEAFIRGMFGGT